MFIGKPTSINNRLLVAMHKFNCLFSFICGIKLPSLLISSFSLAQDGFEQMLTL